MGELRVSKANEKTKPSCDGRDHPDQEDERGDPYRGDERRGGYEK